MARPLKVPRERALEAAMQLFWSQGYNSTSVDDLQKAMGIQRGSFYFCFKDKRSLFIEALTHYRKIVVEKRRAMVRANPSPKAGIQLYFKILFEHLIGQKPNAGCLNTNSATEWGISDGAISDQLARGMNDWRDFWIEILEAAKSKNEIPPRLDIISTAQLLVALTQGLNVVARVNRDPQFLTGVINAGLSILEGPNPV